PDKNPLGGQPRQMVAGYASTGPVYLGGPGVNGKTDYGLLNGKTGRPVAYTIDPTSVKDPVFGVGIGRYGSFATRVRVSGDGLVLGEQRFKFADKVMPLYERLFLIPSAKALVVVPDETDKVHVYAFDVVEQLQKNAARDFLVVASRPPAEARKAARFTYSPFI